jgi:type I restriction modification DNA specificity domain protein
MGVPHLTQENLKSVRIPLPHIEEQKEIADYLDAKCAEIDDLIKVKQEKIGTLKEYRQSLIFEAVTGKIEL